MGNVAEGVSAESCSDAEEGNSSELEKCLNEGAKPVARNIHHTLLDSAIRSNNQEVIKIILHKIKETQGTVTPYIDDKDALGLTQLIWTAKCNLLNSARILLEYGADTEVKNKAGMTALHYAAACNHIEIMKLLISKGADINAKDNDGRTPLDMARESRCRETAGYLEFCVSEMSRKQGKYNDALLSYKKAYNKQEFALGPNHPDVLMTLHNIGVVLANQGKHKEALGIYQEVFDIQNRGDVLGPDHPDTLLTRYNMAVSFNALGDSNEVYKIFPEFLTIMGAPSDSDSPAPLTSSDIKLIRKEKLSIRNLSQEGDNNLQSHVDTAGVGKRFDLVDILDSVAKKVESTACSSSEENPEESVEEIFEPKFHKMETLKWSIRRYLQERVIDHIIIAEEDGDREIRHFFLLDSFKKEKWYELVHKNDAMDTEGLKAEIEELYSKKGKGYGKTHYLGFDENAGENLRSQAQEKLLDFLVTQVYYDLSIIKEECENVSVYHYVLIDPHKRKMFLEQSSADVSLLKKVEKCAIVLYSCLGEDPNEIISDKILEAYFCPEKGIFENIFAKLGFRSFGRSDWTSLHDAAYVGNLKAVKNLTEDWTNCHVKDAACGRKPVHIAAREGHRDIVEVFLNKGIKVNETDEIGWTVLHYAAWSGHLRTVKLLIDRGADIHAKEGTRSKKPIHIAAERGNKDILNLLLRSGATADEADKEGRTTDMYNLVRKDHLIEGINLADFNPFGGDRKVWTSACWMM